MKTNHSLLLLTLAGSLLVTPPLFANETQTGTTMNNVSQVASDTAITAQIKGKFISEKLFGDVSVPVTTITVETNKGKVVLGGTAENKDQKDKAYKIASEVAGSNNVTNNIGVPK